MHPSIESVTGDSLIAPLKQEMKDSLKGGHKDFSLASLKGLSKLRSIDDLDELKRIAQEDPSEKVRKG
jgi:hypothetical protein